MTSVTPTSLRVSFPEFTSAEDTTVQASIDRADRTVSNAFLTIRDDVIELTAAHYLALSPFGRDSRLSSPKDGSSVYMMRLKILRASNALTASRVK